MPRLRWLALAGLCAITALGIANGVTTPTQYQTRLSVRQAERDGDALFHSPALGTNAATCDTCHVDGGRFSHRIGDVRLPSLVGAKHLFPTVDPQGRVTTLEAQINQCIVREMRGRPLSPSGRRMGLLDLYLRHLSRFHER
jgi:cytochrome c